MVNHWEAFFLQYYCSFNTWHVLHTTLLLSCWCYCLHINLKILSIVLKRKAKVIHSYLLYTSKIYFARYFIDAIFGINPERMQHLQGEIERLQTQHDLLREQAAKRKEQIEVNNTKHRYLTSTLIFCSSGVRSKETVTSRSIGCGKLCCCNKLG